MKSKRHIELQLGIPLPMKKSVYCFEKHKWMKYGDIRDPISNMILDYAKKRKAWKSK
jgi:hypothetical protein